MNYRAHSGVFKRNFKIWRIGLSHRGGANGDANVPPHRAGDPSPQKKA
jgi:hypothetical protein